MAASPAIAGLLGVLSSGEEAGWRHRVAVGPALAMRRWRRRVAPEDGRCSSAAQRSSASPSSKARTSGDGARNKVRKVSRAADQLSRTRRFEADLYSSLEFEDRRPPPDQISRLDAARRISYSGWPSPRSSKRKPVHRLSQTREPGRSRRGPGAIGRLLRRGDSDSLPADPDRPEPDHLASLIDGHRRRQEPVGHRPLERFAEQGEPRLEPAGRPDIHGSRTFR